MGSLVLAEPEISLFGRKTVQRLTMAFHSHPLLTLSVLLLFSILAVSAETRTMTCSRRWNNPDIDHKDDFALNDGRQITVNATTIINTNGADFERWYQPEISNRKNKRTGKRKANYVQDPHSTRCSDFDQSGYQTKPRSRRMLHRLPWTIGPQLQTGQRRDRLVQKLLKRRKKYRHNECHRQFVEPGPVDRILRQSCIRSWSG